MIFAALNYTLEKGSQVGRLYISNNRGARGGTRLTGKREASEGRRRRRRKYRGQPVIFVWDSSILRAPPIKPPTSKALEKSALFFPRSIFHRSSPRVCILISIRIMASLYGFSSTRDMYFELNYRPAPRPVARSCSIFPLYSGSRIASRFIYYIILYQHARARTHE